MAQDIPDYTQAVNVTGGSVSITGIASVSISGTPAVTISGTPVVNVGNTPSVTVTSGTINIGNTPTVILGAGTASVGSISAISSTVTVAGTINIGNTPAVTISGTPTVNIASGTVTIGGSPTVNVTSANGVSIVGPNLLPADMAGPITGGWTATSNCTITYTSNGNLSVHETASTTLTGVSGPIAAAGVHAPIRVFPGQTYQISAWFKTFQTPRTARISVKGYDAALNQADYVAIATGAMVFQSYVQLSGLYTVPAVTNVSGQAVYYISFDLFVDLNAQGVAGDTYEITAVSIQALGSLPATAQQGALPTTLPQIDLGQILSPGAGEGVTTLTLPTGTQAVALRLDSGLYGKYDHVIVRGHSNLPNTKTVYFSSYFFNQEIYSFPVLSVFDQQIEVAIQNNDGATVVSVEVVALLQSVTEFLQLFPDAKLRPNQAPVLIDANIVTSGNTITVLSPQANVQYIIFGLRFTANQIIYLTHGTSSVGNTGTRFESTVGISGSQDFAIPGGYALPVGHGLYLDNESGASATVSASVFWSKK